jgi:endonuclease/exonuclease/phosphatase family metal-dependent hydrolase
MKIATWNLERLKHKKNLIHIVDAIKDINADILVLTEYDEQVKLDFLYPEATDFIQEDSFGEKLNIEYKSTERRVKIFSRYEILHKIETFNKYTSVCVELKTPKGNLIVYGTIIGILGNRHKNFNEDLAAQIEDFKRFGFKANFCVAGDFNISFSDNHYFTHHGRDALNEVFKELDMEIPTASLKGNIDHIAISNAFLQNQTPLPKLWNEKTTKAIPPLSDHMGVWVEV